jgi:hypothetical protein
MIGGYMFGPDEIILISVLIAGTAAGTYIMCSRKYHQLGYQFGVKSTLQSLAEEGFLEIEKDEDGEDSIVSIREVKSRAITRTRS